MLDTAAREAADVHFDNPTRNSHSHSNVPLGGVPRALRESAEMAGLDPIAELYNEALRYASEGHLRLAKERLQMLLCMKPDDGDARLMLAKIHVAGQRWQDAVAALDEATNCGAQVPMDLRRAVEDHLRAEAAAEDEERSAKRAREQGEIRALRQEARRLRSENAQLVGRTSDLEREARRWAWTTAGASMTAVLFITANLILGGGSTEAVVVEPSDVAMAAAAGAPESGEAVEVEANEAEPVAPASATTLAQRAKAALEAAPGLDNTHLEVEFSGAAATLHGDVVTARQRRTAKAVVGGIQGVDSVEADNVVITARTKGSMHEVQKGDSLSKIASHYYGDSTLSSKIYKANRGTMRSPASLSIGQVLKIPAVD